MRGQPTTTSLRGADSGMFCLCADFVPRMSVPSLGGVGECQDIEARTARLSGSGETIPLPVSALSTPSEETGQLFFRESASVMRIGIWDNAFAYVALDSSANRIVLHLSSCIGLGGRRVL